MEILIGLAVLVIAAALICLWLAGGLFGRVLAFLILAPVLALTCSFIIAGNLDAGSPWGLLAGPFWAWIIASLPAYHQRGALWQSGTAKAR